MAASLPILGFREWIVRGDGVISGIRGEPWTGATMEARCPEGHPAPDPGCVCGIYAIDEWPGLGDRRLYEQATLPFRLAAQALLSMTVLMGLVLLLAMDWPLLHRGSWLPAVVIALAMGLGLSGMAAADLAVGRSPYLLGAVVLSGRILRHRNGVLRAEHARIACLVRPPGVGRKPAGRVALRLGVPLFHWYQRQRALAYLSEHGDLWPRAAAQARRNA
ncbi:MAG TPA: hypothetical protein VKY90_20785 [Candidatus Dormibacteraeota bacterium]|nr:hypothetical protein [Candidatus Dormibacteraeota bacterium]